VKLPSGCRRKAECTQRAECDPLPNNEASRTCRHVEVHQTVGFVVDGVRPPRRHHIACSVRGTGEVVPARAEAPDQGALIRITPTHVTSWGLEES